MLVDSDPLWSDGSHQRWYRLLLDAHAHPLIAMTLTETNIPAWLAVVATCCDQAVQVADPHGLISPEQRAFIGSAIGAVTDAPFIVADGARNPIADPSCGTIERPELGATLVIRVAQLGGTLMTLHGRGPGIHDINQLGVDGLLPTWLESRQGWCRQYPCGVDIMLIDDCRVAALPRSTALSWKVI